MDEQTQDEVLIEMLYRWADIETGIEHWVYHLGKPNQEDIGKELAPALSEAFRVEAKAYSEWNEFEHEIYYRYGYEILFRRRMWSAGLPGGTPLLAPSATSSKFAALLLPRDLDGAARLAGRPRASAGGPPAQSRDCSSEPQRLTESKQQRAGCAGGWSYAADAGLPRLSRCTRCEDGNRCDWVAPLGRKHT